MNGLLLGVLLVGCGDWGQDPTLQPFASCEEMGDYIGEMALREADAAHEFSFGFGGWFSTEYSFTNQSFDQGATEYSETNVQEVGVDEADLIKTDGLYLYAVSDGALTISLGWPIEHAGLLSTTDITGELLGLYLFEDTVVVISQADRVRARSGVDPGWDDAALSGVITVLDVSDRAAPVVTRELWLSGAPDATRRIDDRLFVLARLDMPLPEAHNLRAIKKAVKATSPLDWLPKQFDSVLRSDGGWDTDGGAIADCTDVWWSQRQTGTEVTYALSIDLSDPNSALSGQAVVGRIDDVYMSPEAIYAAYSDVSEGPFKDWDDSQDTVIHKFDVSGADAVPTYVDTVQLTGVIPDRFALSEHDGVLRAATTDLRTFTTNVWTVGEEHGALVRLGHLGDLAPDEELYSVRFVGDLGYLVTYVVAQGDSRMDDPWTDVLDVPLGDPLFTIDLSDPTDPRAIGELKLNGWSDYIHPMSDDRLLTVGMNEDSAGVWKVAVSLFDVGDLTAPRLVDRELLNSDYTEARSDPHAFNWFAPQETLTLPTYSLEDDWGLAVLKVGRDDITSVGRVVQETVVGDDTDNGCGVVRRSVILEDQVWAYSEAGLTAAALDAPWEELNAVVLTEERDCDWGWRW